MLAHIPIRTSTGEPTISHGYRIVTVPDELRHLINNEPRVVEHRLVMAQHLNRPLFPDEVVHHRNGSRTDNRIENLELWSVSHPKGQTKEDKVAWAIDVLRRYRPAALREHLRVPRPPP